MKIVMKFITTEQKEKIQKFLNRFMNISIVIATLVAGIGIGYYFHELKVKPARPVNIDLETAAPAIDYQGNLLLDGKKYSDSTLRVITRMGVKHIYQ
jgi:hypothetical protein